jgi:excinuclease UvrABC nuclease subunit
MPVEPVSIPLPAPGPALDAILQSLPDSPAVFLLTAAAGQPYLSKSALLGRRLRRLLAADDKRRAALNLRGLVERLDYWPTASRLESAILFYTLARHHYPDSYLKLCNLRMPSYMRLLSRNPFPRTQVTTRPSARGLAFGPFRSRASAEEFEKATLDLFQVRRCQEDLIPSPDHPGCIYGEMAQCLRPCQDAVSPTEYASEVARLVEFLQTEGRSLAEVVERMRDRFSADMEFEEAARQHRRLEKIQSVWRLRDELATGAASMNGVAVLKSVQPGYVTLLFLLDGAFLPPLLFPLHASDGRPVSLDHRLRDAVLSLAPPLVSQLERAEHLALLARWFYSSWRDGEWLNFPTPESVSYRKFVNMVNRVAAV